MPAKFKLSGTGGKVKGSYLCSHIFLSEPHVETLPFSFRLRHPENRTVDAAGKTIESALVSLMWLTWGKQKVQSSTGFLF